MTKTLTAPKKRRVVCAIIASSALAILASAQAQQSTRPAPNSIEQLIQVDVPVVLCIDDKPSGGQPTSGAYAKAAANGFRSILTLRNEQDGVDRSRERAMVERENLRYFNISVIANEPRPAQADQFLALVRDKSNHPMLINCAFAERVAPLMMIFRIAEQGWSEEKALDEAVRMGIKREPLRKFAQVYLTQRKSKQN